MQKFYLFLIVIIVLSAGCGPLESDLVKREYLSLKTDAPLADSIKNKAASIELFEYGQSLPFKYQRLGVVKALGAGQEKPAALKSHLLYETWKQGGNAVIGVKDTTVVRYFKDEGRYKVPAQVGIAVWAEKDRRYLNSFATDSSYYFVQDVEKQRLKIVQKRADKAFIGVMQTILYGGIITLGIIYGGEEEE